MAGRFDSRSALTRQLGKVRRRRPIQLDLWEAPPPVPSCIVIYLACASRGQLRAANSNKARVARAPANTLPAWAAEQTSLSGRGRKVLAAIAKHADRRGDARFSLRALAIAADVSPSNIREPVDELLKAQVITLKMVDQERAVGAIAGFAFRITRNTNEFKSALRGGFYLSRGQATDAFDIYLRQRRAVG